jgi:hypothetical protein
MFVVAKVSSERVGLDPSRDMEKTRRLATLILLKVRWARLERSVQVYNARMKLTRKERNSAVSKVHAYCM